jgi:hypothetical protein
MYLGNSDCEFVKWFSSCTEFDDVLRKTLTADFCTNTKSTRVSLTVAERVQHSLMSFLSKTSRPPTIFAFNPFVHSLDERFRTRKRFSLSSFPRSQTSSSLQLKALPSHSTPLPSYLSNHEDQRPPFAPDACRLRSRRCTSPRALIQCFCSLPPCISLLLAFQLPYSAAGCEWQREFRPRSRPSRRPKTQAQGHRRRVAPPRIADGGQGPARPEGGQGTSRPEGGQGAARSEGGQGTSSPEGGQGTSSPEGSQGAARPEGAQGREVLIGPSVRLIRIKTTHQSQRLNRKLLVLVHPASSRVAGLISKDADEACVSPRRVGTLTIAFPVPAASPAAARASISTQKQHPRIPPPSQVRRVQFGSSLHPVYKATPISYRDVIVAPTLLGHENNLTPFADLCADFTRVGRECRKCRNDPSWTVERLLKDAASLHRANTFGVR